MILYCSAPLQEKGEYIHRDRLGIFNLKYSGMSSKIAFPSASLSCFVFPAYFNDGNLKEPKKYHPWFDMTAYLWKLDFEAL
jgi:hypothetical protein